MIHIGFSGGGLKGIGHLGVAEVLTYSDIKPNVLSGISVGSIMAILYALVSVKLLSWVDITRFWLNVQAKDVFNVHPKSWKSLLRAITFKSSLGKQANLKPLLKRFITKDIFDAYKSNPNSPDVYVGYVNYNTKQLEIRNIKNYNYLRAINFILASSHVPVATEAIKIFDSYAYDGGLIDHSISAKVLKIHDGITTNINIWSRPSKDQVVENPNWKPKNWFNVANRTLEIGMLNISWDDEEHIKDICKLQGIDNHNIYLPSILRNMYDFDKDRLYELYMAGRKKAFEFTNEYKI